MYYLTHITFQGVAIITLVVATLIGYWWAER
jgi:hypothetical protein